MAAERKKATRVGHADDAVFGLAGLGEMGREAFPDARNHELGARRGQPAIQRGDDVRVRVRGDQIGKLLRREIARHAHVEFIEGQVAARIDDGAFVVIDDQELVGLDRFSVLLDEIGKHEAYVIFVTIQLDRHDAISGKLMTCHSINKWFLPF